MNWVHDLGQLRSAVATYASLPLSGNSKDDVRIASDTGTAYVWTNVASSGALTDWAKLNISRFTDLVTRPTSSPLAIDDAVQTVTNLTLNVVLLGFNLASQAMGTVYKMVDMLIDQYRTQDGIDADLSTGEVYFEGVKGSLSYYEPTFGGLDVYTKALCHFNGSNGSTTIVDVLQNEYTCKGTAQLSTAQKKFGTASLLLDGNSDYLEQTMWINPYNVENKDFTFDMWIYPTASGKMAIVGSDDGTHEGMITPNHYDSLTIEKDASNKLHAKFGVGDDYHANWSYIEATGSTSIASNEWTHIAIVRASGYIKLFVNGVLDATSSTASNDALYNYMKQMSYYIGFNNPINTGASYFQGYIDEFRYTCDLARWTNTFTPSTLEYNTPTGTVPTPTIEDKSASAHVVTVNGNAQMTGQNALFGNASCYFDGINSYLSTPDSEDFDFPSNVMDSYTKLLIHGDSIQDQINFVEETGKTISYSGNVWMDATQKKFGSSSIYFDGTNGYLSVPSSSDLTFGSSDFTVEFWVRLTSLPSEIDFINKTDYPNLASWGLFYDTGSHTFYFQWSNNGVSGGNYTVNNVTLTTGTWYHIAMTRLDTTFKLYVNGTGYAGSGAGISSALYDNSSVPVRIGVVKQGASIYGYVPGYMDEIRISKGIARYTSDFTPQTSAFASTYNEVALNAGTIISNCDFYGGGSYAPEYAFDNLKTTSAATQNMSAGQWGYIGKDWGSGVTKIINRFIVRGDSSQGFIEYFSASTTYFDLKLEGSNDNSNWTTLYSQNGITDVNGLMIDIKSGITTTTAYRYHRVAVRENTCNGAKRYFSEVKLFESLQPIDFTVDLWICPIFVNNNSELIGQWNASEKSWVLYINNSTRYLELDVYENGTSTAFSIISPTAIELNEWSHIAIVRSGTSYKLFVNGVLVGSATSSITIYNSSVPLTIGASAAGMPFNGYIEEVRISKGIARWTSAFTPPSVPYDEVSPDSYTKLLLPLNVAVLDNMTLISNGFDANDVPTSARIVIFEEDIDQIDVNIDIRAYVSRDGGATFTQVLLAKEMGFIEDTLNICTGSVDLSTQPSGQLMVYKIVTANNVDLRIYGCSLGWK